MIPGSANPLLLASAAPVPTDYEIERSLRFNSADSAYLSRTPASVGNRKTWTWAGWVKRSGSWSRLFVAGSALFSNPIFTAIGFDTDKIVINEYNYPSAVWGRDSVAVFRDYSAWYHIVVAVDTTQATDTNRVRLYVNGAEQSTVTRSTYSAFPSQSADTYINTTTEHQLSASNGTNSSNLYLADVHFIDGQALDPTSFGEFDTNGIWQPIEYTGSYGTNGFHLPFDDNSTAAALGTDTSGNSNTWTVNNISVTAGAGNDSLVDVPTNGTETDTGVGGEVRGNYCTLNPLDTSSSITLENGNLVAKRIGDWRTTRATIGITSGKFYWEITSTTATTSTSPFNSIIAGITKASASLGSYVGSDASGWGYSNRTGVKVTSASGTAYGASWTSANTIGVALDADNGTITFYKDNASQGQAFNGLTSGPYFPSASMYADSPGTADCIFNFGQRPFAYTAPSGFKALCTANLPTPVVTKPSEYMDVVTYTGNGSTQTISGLEFSPDLVWIKNRAQADNHKLLDTVRGATEELESNTTDAEVTNADGLTAFNSDGFDLGADAEYNTNTETYVAWTWDAGSSTVTNTDGSITSQVRANPSAGFSICTLTTQSSGTGTFGHGLNVAPQLVITKARAVSNNWITYHASVGNTGALLLNSTAATDTQSFYWNNTTPTSSVVTLGSGFGGSNSIVAYCFAPVDGYSSFGSYVGNQSSDGPMVYTGFRPRWVMIKNATSVGNLPWYLFDTERGIYNGSNSNFLLANTSEQENYYSGSPAAGTILDMLSNGFKIRSSGTIPNTSNATYIYAAFAENPFALNARAR